MHPGSFTPGQVFQPLTSEDPRQVGGYQLLARLGSGGMGRVYLGTMQNGLRLAIKVVRPELVGDPEFRRRFEQEVAAARQVQSRYTAPLIDADPGARQPWLATAFVAGPSLAQVIAEDGPLPLDTVQRLTAWIAEALQSIHASGVIHRDLKPSNVLLAPDGPRVIDFGIVCAAEATSLTRAGVHIGAPQFMSPEQALGQQSTPALDVFSLGSLAYFAATGRAPFGGGPGAAVLFRIAHENPNLEGCPEPLLSLITRCLAKDPAQRPQLQDIIDSFASLGTTAENWPPVGVLQRLAAYAADPPPPTDPDRGTGPADHPGTRRRGILRVTAGVIVVLAATTYGINLTSGDGSPAPTGLPPVPAPSSTPTPVPTTTAPTPTTLAPATSSPFGTPLPPPTGEPVYLADLPPRGSALSTGSWTILGQEYPKSLAKIDFCGNPLSTTYELDRPYQRLITDVAVADTVDAGDRDAVVNFTVYADSDDDGEYNNDEEVASRAGSWQHPAVINADIRGATSIRLDMVTFNCISGETVWATPRLY